MYPFSRKSLLVLVLLFHVVFMFDYFNSLLILCMLLIFKSFALLRCYHDTTDLSYEEILGEFNLKIVVVMSTTLLVLATVIGFIFQLLRIKTDITVATFSFEVLIYFIAYSFAFAVTNILVIKLLMDNDYNLSFNIVSTIVIILNLLPSILGFPVNSILLILIQIVSISLLNKIYLKDGSLINYFYIYLTYNLVTLVIQHIY
ncbi:hypothetical protein A5798_002412 [Enterococcus sp. 6C8_DIV0013]|nr:hypothetical protein A5798_002412 [Enterococcus sp. 6C8_DIV0013]